MPLLGPALGMLAATQSFGRCVQKNLTDVI